MLKHLKMVNVGPAPQLELALGQRLNLLTGDNGLGKSFLLDVAWWAMTRVWPAELNPALTSGKRALPTDKKAKAEIGYSFPGVSTEASNNSEFVASEQSWKFPQGRQGNPGLVFYALADGSFAVWDPARNRNIGVSEDSEKSPAAYVFSPKEVWDGLPRPDGAWLCNGLIRDWASWQKEKGQGFKYLKAVLETLSPSAEERIAPGALTRISLDDSRDMPTLKMPYGQEVAVVHASAGMRRVISLAYFLVWCWEEHLKASKLLGSQPDHRATFLVDEVEAHLHPKWQRSVIPALLKVMGKLTSAIDVQLIVATHSPLVMASAEPLFDSEKDAWFDLDLEANKVTLTPQPFAKQGDAARWLTSEAFDLQSSYSIEAETVREQAALALSQEDFNKSEAKKLDTQLRKVLSDTDPFWARWRHVGEKKGWLP